MLGFELVRMPVSVSMTRSSSEVDKSFEKQWTQARCYCQLLAVTGSEGSVFNLQASDLGLTMIRPVGCRRVSHFRLRVEVECELDERKDEVE